MEIKIKKLNENAIIPAKWREWDACFDLYSLEDHALPPNWRILVKTWIAMEIPEWFYWQIESRSWLASKEWIFSIWWVIDSNYRWDVGVILMNWNNKWFIIKAWDRIAQIWFHKVEDVKLIEAVELSENTERWDNGFWSSWTDKIVVYNHI